MQCQNKIGNNRTLCFLNSSFSHLSWGQAKPKDYPTRAIEVVVHPESLVHACVEFCDGSVLAQMGAPSMATPIAFALYYPRRPPLASARLDLAGAGRDPAADGRSLMPLILRAAGAGPADDSFRRPVIAYLDRRWGSPKLSEPFVSVTDGDLRLMWWPKRPNRTELFNLAEDPAELKNLFREDDPSSQRLLQMVQQHYENSRSPWGAVPDVVELDALRLNQLRALGYVVR